MRFATGVGIRTWWKSHRLNFAGTARGSERFGYIDGWLMVRGMLVVLSVSFLVSLLVVLSLLCAFMVSLPFFPMVVGLILIQGYSNMFQPLFLPPHVVAFAFHVCQLKPPISDTLPLHCLVAAFPLLNW